MEVMNNVGNGQCIVINKGTSIHISNSKIQKCTNTLSASGIFIFEEKRKIDRNLRYETEFHNAPQNFQVILCVHKKNTGNKSKMQTQTNDTSTPNGSTVPKIILRFFSSAGF